MDSHLGEEKERGREEWIVIQVRRKREDGEG